MTSHAFYNIATVELSIEMLCAIYIVLLTASMGNIIPCGPCTSPSLRPCNPPSSSAYLPNDQSYCTVTTVVVHVNLLEKRLSWPGSFAPNQIGYYERTFARWTNSLLACKILNLASQLARHNSFECKMNLASVSKLNLQRGHSCSGWLPLYEMIQQISYCCLTSLPKVSRWTSHSFCFYNVVVAVVDLRRGGKTIEGAVKTLPFVTSIVRFLLGSFLQLSQSHRYSA